MRLSQIESALRNIESLNFKLPDGTVVPQHFHITEIGHFTKKFIDCGGVLREEEHLSFQLYTATDYDHRLSVEKLKSIIHISKEKLNLPDLNVKVEHQGRSIEVYDLDFVNGTFHLIPTQTDCLAKDNCGIPSTSKQQVKLQNLTEASNSCQLGSGCC